VNPRLWRSEDIRSRRVFKNDSDPVTEAPAFNKWLGLPICSEAKAFSVLVRVDLDIELFCVSNFSLLIAGIKRSLTFLSCYLRPNSLTQSQ